MQDNKKYIVVNNGPIPLSKVTVDCAMNLCVPTKKGDSLISVLSKMCARVGVGTIVPQTNADWNATEGAAEILNKPSIFSGL